MLDASRGGTGLAFVERDDARPQRNEARRMDRCHFLAPGAASRIDGLALAATVGVVGIPANSPPPNTVSPNIDRGQAMPPTKLSHVVFQTNQKKEMQDWYCDVLA